MNWIERRLTRATPKLNSILLHSLPAPFRPDAVALGRAHAGGGHMGGRSAGGHRGGFGGHVAIKQNGLPKTVRDASGRSSLGRRVRGRDFDVRFFLTSGMNTNL
jgi:hypothetical protein